VVRGSWRSQRTGGCRPRCRCPEAMSPPRYRFRASALTARDRRPPGRIQRVFLADTPTYRRRLLHRHRCRRPGTQTHTTHQSPRPCPGPLTPRHQARSRARCWTAEAVREFHRPRAGLRRRSRRGFISPPAPQVLRTRRTRPLTWSGMTLLRRRAARTPCQDQLRKTIKPPLSTPGAIRPLIRSRLLQRPATPAPLLTWRAPACHHTPNCHPGC
jgi:hypothetical protein